MSVFLKLNPVDLDKKIGAFQDYLFTQLSIGGFVNVNDWNSYHRIYANPDDRGLIPERYIKEKEYEEVLFDDKVKMSSFFVADTKRTVSNEGMTIVEVSLIVQADLIKIFTTIAHRADEELKNIFSYLSKKYSFAEDFKLTSIEEGINNVYSEFQKENSKLHDMSEKHVFRLKYKVRYTPQCCADC